MSARGTNPATRTRGRPCRKCGGDEWFTRKDGGPACAPCTRARVQRWRERNPGQRMMHGAHDRARKAGVACSITAADVDAVFPADGRCPALGMPLLRSAGTSQDNSPTLDRLVPALGYVPGNICVISGRANRIKNDATASELERVAQWMRAQGLA